MDSAARHGGKTVKQEIEALEGEAQAWKLWKETMEEEDSGCGIGQCSNESLERKTVVWVVHGRHQFPR